MSQNTTTLGNEQTLQIIAKVVKNPTTLKSSLVITKQGIGQTLVNRNFLFETNDGSSIIVDATSPLQITDVKIYGAVPKGKGDDQQWVKGSLLGTVSVGGETQQFGSPAFLDVTVTSTSALLSSTSNCDSNVLGFGVDFVDTSNNETYCWDPEVQNRGNQPIEK